MKQVIHRSETRGHANHGWLNSYHTFSFANYYDESRMHFGTLRVLNDDTVAAGMGFGAHPHNNMEIISIPLEGDLEHKDSMGNIGVIKSGDIQVMSAGSGITHSEYNKNTDKEVKFLQIWLFPNQKNVTPRYDQITLNTTDGNNTLLEVISPEKKENTLWLHQDAWFSLGKFDRDISAEYSFHKKENGVYVFVINGNVQVENETLNKRDGMGIWETDKVKITSLSEDARVLIMEVPMN